MFKTCTTCNKETLFTCEAVYEGFKKTAEAWTCSVCGAVSEETSANSGAKADPLAALFGDEVDTERIHLFDVEAETAKSCRKCKNYVIHPFTQRCSLHDKEVAATDCCSEFEAS